jgi:hypothetical protein
MRVSYQPHPPPLPCFTPAENTPVFIAQKAGWAPEPVWTQRLEENSAGPVEDWTPVVQSVVRHYTILYQTIRQLTILYHTKLDNVVLLQRNLSVVPHETIVYRSNIKLFWLRNSSHLTSGWKEWTSRKVGCIALSQRNICVITLTLHPCLSARD